MLSFCSAPYRLEKSEASCRTSSGQVAENMRVCRSPSGAFLGMLGSSTIFWISGMKPISNILSASSNTRKLQCESDTLPFSTKSSSLDTMVLNPDNKNV